MNDTFVIAVCMDCEKERRIGAGEIEAGDHPMCECGGILIAKEAVDEEADVERDESE